MSVKNIIKDLDKINYKKAVKIRIREMTGGGYSVYLDIWHDSKREYLYPKIRLQGTGASKDRDLELIRIAVALRDRKELELISNQAGFTLSKADNNTLFLPYFSGLSKGKQNNYHYSAEAFKRCFGDNILFCEIDFKLCSKFAEYLKLNYAQNSAVIYFNLFKTALNKAVKSGLIIKTPAVNVSLVMGETKREFLTIDEIKLLINARSRFKDITDAFLFSCFTGLRISDLRQLRFSQIKDGYIEFKQQKTGGVERIKLSDNALQILSRRADKDGLVFKLPPQTSINRYLLEWTEKNGIDKHITFHCARHTFATLCLTYDIDLYTVSKLLGHRDIKTTQIYAKLIDKKKDEAIDKLPKI